jgi:hypothetical protein
MISDRIPAHDCARAHRAVHRLLDGERLDAALAAWLERHEEGCAECRAFRADLETIQASLRSWPELELPRPVIDAVRVRNARANEGRSREGRRVDWRPFAAGVLLTAAAFGAWEWSRRAASPAASTEPESTLDLIVIDPERVRQDPEYARQIAERAVQVLAQASRALERGERLAVRDVLGDVSGALERIPMDWPETSGSREPRETRPRENEL